MMTCDVCERVCDASAAAGWRTLVGFRTWHGFCPPSLSFCPQCCLTLLSFLCDLVEKKRGQSQDCRKFGL